MTIHFQRSFAVRSVFLSFIRLLSLATASTLALPALAGPFDDEGYTTRVDFDTPMSTIAGLTDWAKDINYVYGITTWISVLIFFAVAIPVVIAIYKFRVKPGEEDDDILPPQTHGNAILEFTWTIIPCILLVIIAVPTWKSIFKQAAEPKPEALLVEVIGHQWWWEFRYPSLNLVTANELHLPENRQIFFQIKSADVIHSFWIPQFGGKVDALPGKAWNRMLYTTPTLAESDRVGGKYYQGQCVELCGLSHALMRFSAVLHTQEEFDSWAKTHDQAPKVETAQQQRGEQVFAQCVACHTISGTPSADIQMDKIGPDLSNFGSRAHLGAGTRRNTPENLALWLDNPPALKPGSLMPDLGLSPEDIAAVSAYLRQSTAKRL